MEGIRSDDDEAKDKDKLSDGKKKPAGKVGLFALEQKNAKSKNETEKRQDLLSLLTRKTVEVESKPDKDRVEEQLTATETKQIEQTIIDKRHHELQATDTSELNQEEIVALQAIESFYEKILSDDIDSNQSLIETLDELSSSEPSSIKEIVPIEFTEELISIDRTSEADHDDQDFEEIYQTEKADDQLHEFSEEPVSIKSIGHESPIVNNVESEDSNIFTQLSQTIAAAPRTIASLINPKTDRAKDEGLKTNKDETKTFGKNSNADIVRDILAGRESRLKSDKPKDQIKNNIEQNIEKIEQAIVNKELIIREIVANRDTTKSNYQSELTGRAMAPEASRLHSSVVPERIGRVLMTAEANKSKAIPKTETATLRPIDRSIETISRADLLELSGQATVDGSTLRQAYETNLISEKALRRLVAEHLSGGDVRRALRRELVEHEKDFERDPQLRDKSHRTAGGSNIPLNKLIQRLENNQPTTIKDSIIIKTQTPFAVKQHRKQKRLSWPDVIILITILVLLLIVTTLVISRQ